MQEDSSANALHINVGVGADLARLQNQGDGIRQGAAEPDGAGDTVSGVWLPRAGARRLVRGATAGGTDYWGIDAW